MNAGQQLYPILKDLVDGRVYQLVRREGADTDTPYIVYTPISTVPENVLDGYLGYESSRIQIDIYHDDYDELDTVADNVIAITALQSSDAMVAICKNGDVLAMRVDRHGTGSLIDTPYVAAKLQYTSTPQNFSCQLISDVGQETSEHRNVFLLVLYDTGLAELVNVGYLM